MLNREEIKKIADLARLELTEAEVEKMGKDLSGVLNYIDQLKEVDTEGVEPTAQVTGLIDVWREDEFSDWPSDEIRESLNQAPDGLLGNQIKVKRVLE